MVTIINFIYRNYNYYKNLEFVIISLNLKTLQKNLGQA